MKLVRTFSKIMLVRNHLQYIRMICSIIIAYVLISFISIYIDGMLMLHPHSGYSEQRYIFISTFTVSVIAGITLVIYQMYSVMLSGLKDYYILRRLGATNHHLRILNSIQGIFLLIVTIPIGLCCGYFLTSFLADYARLLIIDPSLMEQITSTSTVLVLAGVICCTVISIAVYLNINISKMTLPSSKSDGSANIEEIWYGNM